MTRTLRTPIAQDVLESLVAGDEVLLSGEVYTGRDAAHKRLMGLLEAGKPLPFDPRGRIIFYVGPCPARPGQVMGSAGPTSSYRMDDYTPALLDLGLKAMIGKGPRSADVVESIRKNRAVYFAGIGGAGALIARCIKRSELIAFEDLGTEAMYRFTMEGFPLVVAIDSRGNDLYEIGPKRFRTL